MSRIRYSPSDEEIEQRAMALAARDGVLWDCIFTERNGHLGTPICLGDEDKARYRISAREKLIAENYGLPK